MVDKTALAKEMVDKWSIKPSLAEKLVDILFFMRQLTEFGYLEANGGNKNRSYSISPSVCLQNAR